MQRRHVFAFAGVVILFIVVRLLLLWRFPPFFDEAFYAVWAFKGAADPTQRFVSLTIGDEPLSSWGGMLGVAAGLAPLTAIRLVSFLSGLATLALSGVIAHRLGGARAALATCVLVALAPILLVHDVIGIRDPLVTALMAAAVLLQLRLARQVALADALLLGIALGAGTLTKATSYPAFVLLPFSLICFRWSAPEPVRRLVRWCLAIALALITALALYSIMKLSPLWDVYVAQRKLQSEGASASQASHTVGDGLRHPWHWLSLNWPVYSSELVHYVTIPVLVMAAVGLVAAARRCPRTATFVGLWFVIPFTVSLLLTDVQYPRYLLTSTPPLLVLAGVGTAWGLGWILRLRVAPSRRLAVGVGAALVLIVPAAIFDARVLASPTTARFPGLDEQQYVRSGAALEPYKALDRMLRKVSQGRAVTVALGDFTSSWFELDFRNEPNITLQSATAPPLCKALYAIETQVPLPARTDGLVWHPVAVYPRPNHGVPTTLYETGVPYRGRVATTPDELRRAIGGSDSDFDAYGHAHPCVQQWEQAWYDLHPQG